MDEPLRDESRAQPASFDLLPTHVLLEILKYNSAKDWRMLRQTSRRFRKLLPLALLEQRFNEEFHQLEKNAPNQKIGVADIVRALLKSHKLQSRTITIQADNDSEDEEELSCLLLDGQDIDTYIEIDDRAAVWVILYAEGHGRNSPPLNSANIYLNSLKRAIAISRTAIVGIFLSMIELDVIGLNKLLLKTFLEKDLSSQTRFEILSLLLEAGAQADSVYDAVAIYCRQHLTKEILELLLFNGLRFDPYIGSLSDYYNIDLSGSKNFRKNILFRSFPNVCEQLEATREQQVTKDAKKSQTDIEDVANLLLATNRLKTNIKLVETAKGKVECAEVLLDDKNLEYFIQQHDIGAVYVMLFTYAQRSCRGPALRRSLDELETKGDSAIPRPNYVAWLRAATQHSSLMVAIFCQMTFPTKEELNQQLRAALLLPPTIVNLLLSHGASVNCLLKFINDGFIRLLSREILVLLFSHGLDCNSFQVQKIFSHFKLDLVSLRECEKKFREACNIFADCDGIERMKEPPEFLATEAEALKQKACALLLEAYKISPEILDILCQLKKGLSAINSFHDAIEVIKDSSINQPVEYKMQPRAQR